MLLPTLAAALAPLSPPSAAPSQCETKLPPPMTSTQDEVGHSVGVYGDVLVSGAPGDDEFGSRAGAAYVYERLAGTWQLQTKLVASDATENDLFGESVSIHGDTILVGASFAAGVGSDTGAAYVFERVGSAWVETAKLSASDGAAFARFGLSVSVSGTTAAIGAPGSDSRGAVYYYAKTPAGWTLTNKAVASGAEVGDSFGWSVSVHGALSVVGAPGDDDLGLDAGSAYVFESSGMGWVEGQELHASDGNQLDRFGHAVALSGSALVVGVPDEDVFIAQSGAAYLFESVAGTWSESVKLAPPELDGNDAFGTSVAIAQDQVVLGAVGDDDGGAAAGAVYLYERDAGGWRPSGKLVAGDAAAGDHLGNAVGIESGRFVVGAASDEDFGFLSGSTYVFDCVDCNGNGQHDPEEIALGTSFDCNQNGIPDECDISLGTSRDCNTNQVPDECDVPGGMYCFCNNSSPCGNNWITAGCRNSANQGALGDACGTSSVAADDLTLATTGVPANKSGLYFMGPDQIRVPFGDGQRCVASAGGVGTFRFGVQNSGPAGRIALGPGIAALAQQRFGAAGQITPGDTWNFQLWFRDPGGPCGSGFNLGSAFEVLFVP